MGLIKEFREFAIKGNMVDMAVGIIIGAAFGGVVNSLVKDIAMPLVGTLGSVDFSNAYIGLNDKARAAIEATPNMKLADAQTHGPILAWGNFVTLAINFLILAFVVFMVVKMINTAKKKFEAEKAAPAPAGPTKDQQLLTEIRDALRSR
ncbi:MAG: large conductance mechanosensitive channel protein MscL [Phycisphaerales bacterium]|nr:MAG: large conductance mechanosensitive channel protein MscL [Phycisphaerales bacterium]